SYEGVFQALDGAAAGSTSLGIGLSESSDTPVGWSLQLAGSGRTYSDFFWSSGVNSYDAINSEQSFAVVPLPATLPLLLCALAGLLTRRTMNMNDNG
ncbi:MAG: hypothetical protein OES99_11590, partial [Gammaproteobacteria bacterium]|nr:hypothetical protein [Gammaproteobacteria bacterium]